MKKLIMILVLVMTLSLTLAVFASCGSGNVKGDAENEEPENNEQNDLEETNGADDKNVTGEQAEWGNYTVLVPEGFELVEAGDFSSYDFSVKRSDFSYFDFNTEADDETMMMHYNYNKNTYTNEQIDVDATYGDNEWIGFQYSDGYGGYGFEAYTTIGEKIVRVSSAGFKFDSAEAKAILSSFSAK